ncbi:GNAT family N-acetyltransferase [Coleofasciculus sp. G2-EDA-02]|uniref:GNAT family N-acetyltransferase n=1 Tax=Coleofasciculus sp. G2-EDA-02 TaxID=3069529 RepID=UPI0032F4F06F
MVISAQLDYGSISNADNAEQLGELLTQCFASSPNDWQVYLNRIGQDNFRLIRQGEKIVGGLAIYSMGQWYGGQSIPMAGIAAVGIAPEYRGTGAAYKLMQCTLQELHQQGVPISTLYPATQVLYRKVGYEQAGIRCNWQIPTETIQWRDRTLPMSRVKPIGYEVFQDLYSQQAQTTNGNLNRNPAIWQNLLEAQTDQPVYAYLIGEQSQPEGYVICTQSQEANNLLLNIQDWAFLTPAAARRFWTFCADHRSQVRQVRWYSSLIDSLMLPLPEQTAQIRDQKRWMLRILDVSKALEKRGYPLPIETELHLQVQDELFAANNGNFILSVSQGRGNVTPGGTGEFRLHVRALASLFTSLLTPEQLRRMGYLDSTSAALSRATWLFSGSLPWMPDFF